MDALKATINTDGRITLPAEVRRVLELRPGDRVAFVVDGHAVRLVPVATTLAAVYGSVEPSDGDFDAQVRDAKDGRASVDERPIP